MSTTELDGWICPKCGQTNYYHPGRCSHCPDGRRTSALGKLDSSPTVRREKQSQPTDLSEIEDRKKIAFLGSTVLAFASWLYLIWEFHKWDAKWGAMHIGIPTLVVTLLVGGWIYGKSWFRDYSRPAGWRYLVVPLVGFLFCASAGIYFTEPVERGGTVARSGNSAGAGAAAQIASRRSPEYRYDYSLSRASDLYFLSALFDVGEGVGDVAGDAGDMDEFCLVLLLILLVVMLVFGSVVIPHFWALSTFVLLVIMAMFTYREWRLVDHS